MPTIKTTPEIIEKLPATKIVILQVCSRTQPPQQRAETLASLHQAVASGYALGWSDRAREGKS